VDGEREVLNDFMVSCFYEILHQEEKAMDAVFGEELTLKEIHLIDTVYNLQRIGDNNFSKIASKLGITLGTLTTAFSRLERKGYLKKERYLIDQRIYYITPTKMAEKVHKEHQKWHDKMIDDVVKVLPAQDIKNLTKLLEILTNFIKKARSEKLIATK